MIVNVEEMALDPLERLGREVLGSTPDALKANARADTETGLPRARRRRTAPIDRVHLLLEDAGLAAAVPAHARAAATARLWAPVMRVDRGRWTPPTLDPGDTYGLLVLDGLMIRRIQSGEAVAGEIVGPGDLLAPAETAGAATGLEPGDGIDWDVISPLRIAVLDGRIGRLIGRWPELSAVLFGRLLARTDRLAYMLAISHLPRTEDRVLATLSHLASTAGTGDERGLVVPMRLTHRALGEIVGARRSSVTLALGLLEQQRKIIRGDDGRYAVLESART